MEAKLKHLEMIQAVINRMGSNSFIFKGWSITIIAGLSAFAAKDTNRNLLLVSAAATLLFWFVDAYYLMLERAFRKLYEDVSRKDPKRIDFKMNVRDINFYSWFGTLWRPVLCLFYGSVFILLISTIYIIWNP